jgi:hypothetical protein
MDFSFSHDYDDVRLCLSRAIHFSFHIAGQLSPGLAMNKSLGAASDQKGIAILIPRSNRLTSNHLTRIPGPAQSRMP